jgi:hypothetical protein
MFSNHRSLKFLLQRESEEKVIAMVIFAPEYERGMTDGLKLLPGG